MKFAVTVPVTIEAGRALEDGPEGPGPFMGMIAERFHPESFYLAMSERKAFLIVDLASETDVTEFTITIARKLNVYPEMTPVMSIADFPAIAGPLLDKMKSMGI